MPTVTTSEGNTLPYDHYPEECPLCHNALVPLFITAALTGHENERDTLLEMVFKCVRSSCAHLFIGRYERESANQQGQLIGDFKLKECVPVERKASII